MMLEHVHLYTRKVLMDAYMPEQPAYFHTVLTKSTRRRSVWCIEHHLRRKSLRVPRTITNHYTFSKNSDNTHKPSLFCRDWTEISLAARLPSYFNKPLSGGTTDQLAIQQALCTTVVLAYPALSAPLHPMYFSSFVFLYVCHLLQRAHGLV